MGAVAYAARQYKWVVLVPTLCFGAIYYDMNRTKKWKAEKQKALESNISPRVITEVRKASAVDHQVQN